MKDPFSICFNSFHLSCESDNDDIPEGLCEDSQRCIWVFFKDLISKLRTSKRPEQTAAKIDGSVFGLCLQEGYMLIKCTPNTYNLEVSFDGFLLRYDESFRTAWKLATWQVVFLCAEGWVYRGKKVLSIEEVLNTVESIKFPEKMQTKLLGICAELLKSDVPLNFALTGYPVSQLPLNFSNIAAVSPTDDAVLDIKTIMIDSQELSFSKKRVLMDYDDMTDVILACTDARSFMSKKLSEARSSEEKKEWKNDYKKLFANSSNENIWYVCVIKGNKSFSVPVASYYNDKFNRGAIDYNDLCVLVPNKVSEARNFFSAPEHIMEEVPAKEKSTESLSTEPNREEKKSGFFDKMFKKK